MAADMAESSVAPLVERFSGLERRLEVDTKARKDHEEHALSSIKDTLARLQFTLDAEIQRREETNNGLQAAFDSQAASVKDKLEEVFMERFEQVQSTLDSLNERMGDIEKGFARSRGRYVKEAEDHAVLVKKEVDAIRSGLRLELDNRKEREAEISMRMQVAEASTAEKLVRGQQVCDQKFQHLLEALHESRICREAGDRRYQARVIEEVSTLKDSLVSETKAREAADDDIVNALNHYTKELQRAMRTVNQV